MIAGAYERVSRAHDKRARSIAEQAADNRRAAEREGWTLVAGWTDPNRSASRYSTRDRPGYLAMLAAIAAGGVDVLIVWEWSRSSRELEASAHLMSACRSAGTLIHVTSHDRTYDMSVPNDERALGSESVDAAYESGKTSTRTRRAFRANLAAGRPHGLAPYGYQRVYDPADGAMVRQEPDPKTAPIVADIITRVAHGEPIEAVVRDLNGRGVPSPRRGLWSHATVRWLVLNIAYIAKRRDGADLVDGDWPAIVDVDTWNDGVRLLTGADRKVTRPGRARWLLSMIARCAVCGGPMVARNSRGRLVYVCRAGGHVTVPLSVVDDLVSGLVIARVSRPDAYAALAVPGEVVSSARAEAGALRARLASFEAEAISGGVDAASFGRVTGALRAQLEQAERVAAADALPAALRALLTPGEDVAARWAALGIPARKDVLRALFAGITISPPADRKRGPFDPERVHIEWAMS
jgi:site-specific DNA recombinase